MLKKLENNKGITLIALIITIIVLLILAGVTLNTLFGNDSIIAKAREAANAYKNSEKEEQKRFNNINKYINGEEIVEEEEEVVETNPNFFTYSDPDQNDEVLITGFTKGAGGGEEAYTNNDETIIKLVVPKQSKDGKNIKGIGDKAFRNRTKLTKLVLQDNIIQLGISAFSECTGITNLTLPITINEFKYVFNGCTAISKVKLIKGKDGNTEGAEFSIVSSYANYYAYTPWYISKSENIDIEIEAGITKIGSFMFNDCTNLKKIVFPDSITNVGANAFKSCNNAPISASKIKNLTSIGESAFENCTGIIGKIEINSQITEMGTKWFRGCTGITEVVIPGSVTGFQNSSSCFTGCTGITNITVPATMCNYGNSFSNCKNISKVKLTKGKDGNTESGDFGIVSSYPNYYIYTPWYISETEELDIEMEDGITKIGDYMFNQCTNLKKMVFPRSITQIGNNAFKGLKNTNYYYRGSSEEWDQVTGKENIIIPEGNFNYRD